MYMTSSSKTKLIVFVSGLSLGTLMLFFVVVYRNALLEKLNFGIATLRHSQFCPVEQLTSTLVGPGRIDLNPALTSSKNSIDLSTHCTPKGNGVQRIVF